MPRARAILLALAAALCVVLLAGGCLPGAEPALSPPAFRLLTEESGITRLDVVDVEPSASVRLVFEVANGNAFALDLARLDGELWLRGEAVAQFVHRAAVSLPARASQRLALDVTLPIRRLDVLGAVFVDALAGRPSEYRLDGRLTLVVAGVEQVLPTVTLATGSLPSRLVTRPPRVSLDAQASGVRSVAFDRIVIEVALVLHNDGPIGFEVRAPDVRLALGGRDVATVQVPTTALPAGDRATLSQTVVLNPVQLGAAIVSELTRSAAGEPGSVELTLRGPWELSVPGVWSATTPSEELLRVRLE